MPPKKSTKAKKEEVVEIPKTEGVADGPSTHFIGGWSTYQSLDALELITKQRNAGEAVVLLPGVLPTSASGDSATIEVRTLNVTVPQPPKEPVPATDAAEAGEEGGEGDEEEGDADAPPAVPKPVFRNSVTVSGDTTLVAWVPPVEVKPVAPPVAEEKKEAKGKPKKKVVVEEAPQVTQPAVEETPITGADPASWPTVSFRGVCFEGSLTLKGVHANFNDCHFVGGTRHQLRVHQYCNVTVELCSFSGLRGGGVYAYPLANVTVGRSLFNGSDLRTTPSLDVDEADPSGGKSVGIHVDDATVKATQSTFTSLAFGVIVNAASSGTHVSECTFDKIYSTAGVFDNGARCAFSRNAVKRAAYYGLRFTNKSSPKVLQNKVDAPVHVTKGCAPLLHSNVCAVNVRDDNESGNVYMEPKY